MAILTDLTDAKSQLAFELQASLPPVLTDADLGALLAKVERATLWTAATAVAVNDVIIPATANGLRYICTKAGTTGDTEPVWPTRIRGTIGDGDAVWEEAGNQYDLWDMAEAIYQGWILKKAKAVVYIGSEEGLSDIYEHCADMAEQTKPATVA